MPYSLVIISLSEILDYFTDNIRLEAIKYNYIEENYEDIYDWVVLNALHNILNLKFDATLSKHYNQDFYKCIYETLGFQIEIMLRDKISAYKIIFNKNEMVKAIVAEDSLIIAKHFY